MEDSKPFLVTCPGHPQIVLAEQVLDDFVSLMVEPALPQKPTHVCPQLTKAFKAHQSASCDLFLCAQIPSTVVQPP